MSNTGVFFTVVYPQALQYLSDVRDSALLQTRKDFDIVVVNDGCETSQISNILSPLDVTILDSDGGFSSNRLQGINYACGHNYKYILFCDADDTYTPNRYERTLYEFESSHADIVVSNLNIVDGNLNIIINDYFSKEISEGQRIDANFIITKNIFGMSNTAIRLEALTESVKIPETPIVDWYLYTVLLLKGLKAKYIAESLVNYRQYSLNMIGINNFDVANFRSLAKLKNNHYKLLVENGYIQYQQFLQESESLLYLADDEIENIIKNELIIHPQPLWWQIITGNNNNKYINNEKISIYCR